MAKKSSALLAQGKQTKKNASSTRDSEINYSDIPALSDKQLKAMRPLGRPLLDSAPRQMIAVGLDTQVLGQLKLEAKRTGKPYQSLINKILAKHVKKAA